MENNKMIKHQEEEFNLYRKDMVHFILAHSYLIFLFSIILGVLFDTFLDHKIFSHPAYSSVGLLLMMAGTFLIYWAQKTSSRYKRNMNKGGTRSHFESGPYRYSRSPTHLGLFFLTLGFSLMINSFFSVVFTIIAHALTKIVFLKREEKLLEKKYGQVYSDYKKKVRNWL